MRPSQTVTHSHKPKFGARQSDQRMAIFGLFYFRFMDAFPVLSPTGWKFRKWSGWSMGCWDLRVLKSTRTRPQSAGSSKGAVPVVNMRNGGRAIKTLDRASKCSTPAAHHDSASPALIRRRSPLA